MTIIKLADNLTDLPKMPEFTRNQWKELNKGKFVKGHEEYVDDAGHKAGKGIAYMVINFPPQSVWDQILDFNHYKEFFPSISMCRIYKQEDNEIFAEFNLKIGFVINIHYNIHHTFSPTQSRLTWIADQSRKNDFSESKGMWTVWPFENGASLVGYTVSIESGRPVPKIIEDLAAQSGLNKVMAALKKRIKKKAK